MANVRALPHGQRTMPAEDTKASSTLTARAALAGYELSQLVDGTFIARRWGMLRSLENKAAVEGFLAKVGGRQ